MFEKVFAKQHIRNLDLISIRAKLMEKMGWSPEQARTVEIAYKRFLYALVHNEEGGVLSPPTQDVDEFWHQHILDTRKYREDCRTIFGHYVDHSPGLSADDQRKADARRRKVYDDFDIDTMSFDSHSSERPSHDSGFAGCGSSAAEGSHHSHGGHDSGHGHSGDASAHGDAGGHGCDSGSGDSGGGDGGSCGGGGGCGGGGCGGG